MCTACSRTTTRYSQGGAWEPGVGQVREMGQLDVARPGVQRYVVGAWSRAARCLALTCSPLPLQYVVQCHGNTLLPQFLGMFRTGVDSEERYVLAMRNMFSHRLPVHRKYDLKVTPGVDGLALGTVPTMTPFPAAASRSPYCTPP